MHLDVVDLRNFYYRTALGRVAQRGIRERLVELWPPQPGQTVVGFGFAVPLLRPYLAEARRVIGLMPAPQGVMPWPMGEPNVSVLCEDGAWPIATGFVDRLVVMHGLETTDDPACVLEEAQRVLGPGGRVLFIVPNRIGLWARGDGTPFGHGRPYTRSQLADLLREAGLEPTGWTRALYVPPVSWLANWAEGFEQAGSRLWPGFAGLVLTEAVKESFAIKARPARVRAAAPRPGLAPVPVNRTPVSRTPEPR